MCGDGKLFLLIISVPFVIATGVPWYNQAIQHDHGVILSVLIGIGVGVSYVLGFILSCYIIATPIYLICHKEDQCELNEYSILVGIALSAIAGIIGLIMMVKNFVLWIM